MKKLSTCIWVFEEILTGKYVYVNKKENVYRLVTEGKYYFLSRQKRFGKTLLVDTLRGLFVGRKKLFEDCYI